MLTVASTASSPEPQRRKEIELNGVGDARTGGDRPRQHGAVDVRIEFGRRRAASSHRDPRSTARSRGRRRPNPGRWPAMIPSAGCSHSRRTSIGTSLRRQCRQEAHATSTPANSTPPYANDPGSRSARRRSPSEKSSSRSANPRSARTSPRSIDSSYSPMRFERSASVSCPNASGLRSPSVVFGLTSTVMPRASCNDCTVTNRRSGSMSESVNS